MSPTRTPSDEELALAESMFAMFSLFKHVMIDAAQTCDVASPERAKIMSSLKSVLETGKALAMEKGGPPPEFMAAVKQAVATKPWLK